VTRTATFGESGTFFPVPSGVILSAGSTAQSRRSRLEFLRRSVAEPSAVPDTGSFPYSVQYRRCASRVRAPAALDWEAFLALRATELRPGGRLVVALPSLADDGSIGRAAIMDHADAVLLELVTTGLITAEERGRMTLGSCPRRQRDLLAPFAGHGQFKGLAVEHCTTSEGADAAWVEYQLAKDAEALARKRAQFFRAIFVPSLTQALRPSRGAEERQQFSAALEAGLRRRLVNRPARVDYLVAMIVLAKPALAHEFGQ
jgi:hypothetical protein